MTFQRDLLLLGRAVVAAVFGLSLVAASALATPRASQEKNDPERARLVTADVARFWAAYDKAMAAAAEERAAVFEREYLETGTVGLKDFALSRRVSAKALAKRMTTHAKFYEAIRPITGSIEAQRGEVIAAFRNLKTLYPDALFPDTYFVVGVLASGGTVSGNGLLIGTEMFTRSAQLPVDELSEWERGVLMKPEEIPALVAHEAIHFQQRPSQDRTVLMQCLREGSADFVGRLVAGRMVMRMEETHVWANARERELWEEFQKEMYGEDASRWLYGSSGGDGRPVDLGYWMGFKIAEAYYEKAKDKREAVRAILEMTDGRAFLEASGYGERHRHGSNRGASST